MSYRTTPEGKDPRLWHIAHKRASFKRHLLTYIIVNIFLWFVWYFTKDQQRMERIEDGGIPWPVWSTVGWGIGLVFHYIGAYVSDGNSVEREYDKLKNQNK